MTDAPLINHDDYPDFRTKIFIDSNVILECLPLDQLPWRDIDPIGPILVLVTPTVLKEVDSKKRDGRLAVRARDFNRLMAPMVTDGKPVVLTEGPPCVAIAAPRCRRIDWKLYDDLGPEDADACVVAEVLHSYGIAPGQQRIVGQDTHMLITAQRHGVKTFRVPDGWLRPPEQHPKDAENLKLKRQLVEAKRFEPQFAIRFEEPPQPVLIYQVQPLSSDESAALIADIFKAHPKPVQNAGLFNQINYDFGLDKRYAEYEGRAVPQFVQNFHNGLEMFYGQVPITLVVQNTGNIRADNVIIEVQVAGGWINKTPVLFSPSGPTPPRIEPSYEKAFVPPLFNIQSRVVGKHEFRLDVSPRCRNFSAQCEDFRHGQEWSFSGVLWLDPHYARDTVVVIKVTAANLRGESSRALSIKKDVRRSCPPDLIDLKARKVSVSPTIQPLIQEALENGRFEGIEFYST